MNKQKTKTKTIFIFLKIKKTFKFNKIPNLSNSSRNNLKQTNNNNHHHTITNKKTKKKLPYKWKIDLCKKTNILLVIKKMKMRNRKIQSQKMIILKTNNYNNKKMKKK